MMGRNSVLRVAARVRSDSSLRTGTAGLLFCCVLFAFTPQAAKAENYALSPVGDGILLGSGLVLAGFSELFLHQPAPADLGIADINQVNGFDKLAVFGYSRGFDLASDFLLYATLSIPVGLSLFAGTDGAVSMLIPYAESIAFADFSKNLVKYLIPRARPWLYTVGATGSAPDTWEGNDSFPSGHATLAFAAAVFGVIAFSEYYPNSPYFGVFAAVDLGLATTTAVFRVVSGMHFLTDVLTGAALGAAFGALIPLTHSSSAWRSLAGKSVVPASVEIPLLRIPL